MKRNSFIDNYKAVLIILVVLTHFTGRLAGKSDFFKTFEIFNNFFYMPAFIIISGYLSKKNNIVKLVKTLLIPYVFIQFLNILMDMFITHRSSSISLLYPKFTLWYLISLFFWRITIKYISRIKFGLILMIVLALFAGFDENIGTFLSLSRTLYFYPYFLFGYMIIDVENLIELKNKTLFMISSLILIAIFAYLYFYADDKILNVLTGAKDYEKLNLMTWGWLYRLICYAIGFSMSFLVAMVIPKKKLFFTNLGSKTMSIYVFHGLIYQFISYYLNAYQYINSTISYFIFIIIVLIIIWILSTKPFLWIMKKVSSIPIEKLKKEGEPKCFI